MKNSWVVISIVIFFLISTILLVSYEGENTGVNVEIYKVEAEQKGDKGTKPSNRLSALLEFKNGETYILPFKLVNRDSPALWYGKKINIKYTYIGEYNDNTVDKLNSMLSTEYSWKKQLDVDGSILLGGPIFSMDNVYQLHTHNGLSLANKHYLFGDLLHYLYKKDELEGTQMTIGNVVLECIWIKDSKITQDASTIPGVDLVISTCLERHGDRRLVSGWKVIDK